MENKERNLLSLKAEFHDKGKASRGSKKIMELINRNKANKVADLLRFHIPKGVEGQELIDRFEIDALFEYYNLLIVGVFAGYVPGKLDDSSTAELITILDHPSVTPYYQEYYEYKMVSFALQFAKENKDFNQQGNALTISAFNEFISLNRLLKRDKDLECFLGMLDYVWYDGDTINDVINILSSANKLKATFTAKNKTKAQSGVWGFIKYIAFLSQLKQLLIATEEYPLLQSSFWVFHGYYFDRINDKMKPIFNEAFDNLETALGNPKIFETILEEVYSSGMPEEIDEETLRSFAKTAISQSREDFDFILNAKWSKPLTNYFNN